MMSATTIAAPARRRRVLLLDDDRAVLQAVARLLNAHGYDVATVESGEAALALLAARSYDVFLCDISLHATSGLDLVPEARARAPRTPVVMLTGLSDAETAAAAFRAGAADYLTKPLGRQELVAAIEDVVGRTAATSDASTPGVSVSGALTPGACTSEPLAPSVRDRGESASASHTARSTAVRPPVPVVPEVHPRSMTVVRAPRRRRSRARHRLLRWIGRLLGLDGPGVPPHGPMSDRLAADPPNSAAHDGMSARAVATGSPVDRTADRGVVSGVKAARRLLRVLSILGAAEWLAILEHARRLPALPPAPVAALSDTTPASDSEVDAAVLDFQAFEIAALTPWPASFTERERLHHTMGAADLARRAVAALVVDDGVATPSVRAHLAPFAVSVPLEQLGLIVPASSERTPCPRSTGPERGPIPC